MTLKSRLFLLICSMGIFSGSVRSQENINPVVVEYVRTYADLAIREMQRTGVPASIKLAQGILETEAGRSDLVRRSNNHFGIKCKSWWNGEKVYHDDDEQGECFRKYAEAYDSWKDHSDYLKSQPRYAFLFELDPEDYKGWAKGLKKAGYATNPKYPQILIKYIELYHLDDYTQIAMGKKKPTTEYLAYVDIDENKNAVRTTAGGTLTNSEGQNILANNSVQTEEIPKVIYPEGEFKINDTRVIYANEGSSLLAIAETYRIKLKWLYEFNELDKKTEVLEKDQLIFLQRKRRQGFNDFHIFRRGETLTDISQVEGLRLESLLAYNYLEAEMIPATGEKLYLKDEAPKRPKLAAVVSYLTADQDLAALDNVQQSGPSEESILRHVVSAKETLYSLSKKYQVTQEQIREWNKLNSGELRIGQELLIYKSR